MKKQILAFTILVLGLQSCSNRIDFEKEKKAIITVIEEQTNAHLSKDYKRESNTYIQDESTIVLISRKNWYGYLVGWDKLNESIKTNNRIEPKPSTDYIENSDYKIKIYEKSAWAVYDENIYKANGELIKLVINVRFLEKVNGKWKIVYLSDVDTSAYNN